MTTKLTPPLKWHGGKHYMAKRIIELMPEHVHYVEPYAGGLQVLLAKDPEGVSEVANDIHRDLTNFWFVLQGEDSFRKFVRVVEATPFSQVEWEDARRATNVIFSKHPVDRAIRFFIDARQSRAGKMKDFATLSRTRTRRGMNEQASAWMTAVEGLPAVAARLKRVVILNEHAVRVIESQDGPNTLFYCDPPYLAETRTSADDYEHEMDIGDHTELLKTLATIQGKFLLSGYFNDFYGRFAREHDWRRKDFDLPNNAASGKSKRRMTECVWMNY